MLRFNSRWYLFARKSPYALHPVSQKFPNVAFETVPMLVWLTMALSRPLWKIVWRFLFPHLSPPVDRWCHVLGFVPAGTRSFSTLWIFQEASHLWGLLCPPVYLLGHFPSLRRVQGSTPTRVLEGGCMSTIDTFQSGFPIPLRRYLDMYAIPPQSFPVLQCSRICPRTSSSMVLMNWIKAHKMLKKKAILIEQHTHKNVQTLSASSTVFNLQTYKTLTNDDINELGLLFKKSSKHRTKLTRKKISRLALYLIFHRFSPFNCCLIVIF